MCNANISVKTLKNFNFYSISSFCPHALLRSQEKLKNCFVSFAEIKRLISVFDLFFPEILSSFSSVRTAECFSHKSHSWGCTLFKRLFLLLVPLNSRFLLRFNSGLPGRMVHKYSPGRVTQILCFHCLCTQTLSYYLFSSVLENTLMHLHCKCSFYINNALHHDGYIPSIIHLSFML